VNTLVRNLRAFRKRDEGASAVEYGLLVALIAVIIAAAVAVLGSTLSGRFDRTNTCIANPNETNCKPNAPAPAP